MQAQITVNEVALHNSICFGKKSRTILLSIVGKATGKCGDGALDYMLCWLLHRTSGDQFAGNPADARLQRLKKLKLCLSSADSAIRTGMEKAQAAADSVRPDIPPSLPADYYKFLWLI